MHTFPPVFAFWLPPTLTMAHLRVMLDMYWTPLADCPTNTADLTQSTETVRCSLGDVDPHGDV